MCVCVHSAYIRIRIRNIWYIFIVIYLLCCSADFCTLGHAGVTHNSCCGSPVDGFAADGDGDGGGRREGERKETGLRDGDM